MIKYIIEWNKYFTLDSNNAKVGILSALIYSNGNSHFVNQIKNCSLVSKTLISLTLFKFFLMVKVIEHIFLVFITLYSSKSIIS